MDVTYDVSIEVDGRPSYETGGFETFEDAVEYIEDLMAGRIQREMNGDITGCTVTKNGK